MTRLLRKDIVADRGYVLQGLTRRFDKTPVPEDIVSRIVKRIDLCPNAFGPHVIVLDCFHL